MELISAIHMLYDIPKLREIYALINSATQMNIELLDHRDALINMEGISVEGRMLAEALTEETITALEELTIHAEECQRQSPQRPTISSSIN